MSHSVVLLISNLFTYLYFARLLLTACAAGPSEVYSLEKKYRLIEFIPSRLIWPYPPLQLPSRKRLTNTHSFLNLFSPPANRLFQFKNRSVSRFCFVWSVDACHNDKGYDFWQAKSVVEPACKKPVYKKL